MEELAWLEKAFEMTRNRFDKIYQSQLQSEQDKRNFLEKIFKMKNKENL